MFSALQKWLKPLSDKEKLHILMVCMGISCRTYERAGFVRMVCPIMQP
jgi:hypothetical protein